MSRTSGLCLFARTRALAKRLDAATSSDLPSEHRTRYGFFGDLKIAKALGLTIPESILLQANEVIRLTRRTLASQLQHMHKTRGEGALLSFGI